MLGCVFVVVSRDQLFLDLKTYNTLQCMDIQNHRVSL